MGNRRLGQPCRGDVVEIHWEDIYTQWDVKEDELETASRITVGWYLGRKDNAILITESLDDGKAVGGTAFPEGAVTKIRVIERRRKCTSIS